MEFEIEIKGENQAELFADLAKAQIEFTFAKKTSKNPFYNSQYADLAEVIEAVRIPLGKNGLSFMQFPVQTEGSTLIKWQTKDKGGNATINETEAANFSLITILAHSSGTYLTASYPIFYQKGDAQGFGAGVTYAKRYALQALFGLPSDDDDGNTASGVKTENTVNNAKPPVSQPKKKGVTDEQVNDFIENIKSTVNLEELSGLWTANKELLKLLTPEQRTAAEGTKDAKKSSFEGFE